MRRASVSAWTDAGCVRISDSKIRTAESGKHNVCLYCVSLGFELLSERTPQSTYQTCVNGCGCRRNSTSSIPRAVITHLALANVLSEQEASKLMTGCSSGTGLDAA